jgi:tRNA G18 (ribose-2'-O)-methylase SpoU
MSYYEIGVYQTKNKHNIGTLWRSAYQLNAAGIFTIGKRYKKQCSDTCNTINKIPLKHFLTFNNFLLYKPINSILIGIEINGIKLKDFEHPKQAIYLLGAEDNGLPDNVKNKCNKIVSIDSINMASYNVAVAGSIIIYDRMFGFNK